MINRIFNFLFGLVLIFLAWQIYTYKYSIKYGVRIDLSDVYVVASLAFLITGLVFIYVSFRKKIIESYFKCPKCKELFYYKDTKDGFCPNCNIEVVTIEKYWENEKYYLKCPKCKHSFSEFELYGEICPYCETQLIDIRTKREI